MSGKQKYDIILLNTCLTRDNARLIECDEYLTRNKHIKFKCHCGEDTIKNFRQIFTKSGAFCKKCTISKKSKKQKDTNIRKYGVEHPLQLHSILEKSKNTILKNYGVDNPSKSKEIQQRKIDTSIRHFGVEYAQQSDIVRQKTYNTNIKKYGTQHIANVKDIQDRIRLTSLQKYGTSNPLQNKEIKDKIKQTNLRKYGVEYVSQYKEFQEKRKRTNLERYGVEHSSQNQEIMEKAQRNAKKYKLFRCPSGEVRKVQGYEPFALDILLKSYMECQIKTDRRDVPRVEYTIDNKKHYHFPDIYIPSERRIIEVKSTWTYKCKSDNILIKKKACENRGFLYEIWCFDKSGSLINI